MTELFSCSLCYYYYFFFDLSFSLQKINMAWLASRKLADDDKVNQERNALKSKLSNEGHLIRFLSRKGTYNTVTFTEDSVFDRIFPPDYEVPARRNTVCTAGYSVLSLSMNSSNVMPSGMLHHRSTSTLSMSPHRSPISQFRSFQRIKATILQVKQINISPFHWRQ